MFFVDDDDARSWYWPYTALGSTYRFFDLESVGQYHEFIVSFYGSTRVVFTTEVAVRDFSFLRIMWNGAFFAEDAGDDERMYNVEEVLVALDFLTPDVPLVVVGANRGSALAGSGFSFVDEEGIIRFFSFLVCGRTGFLVIGEF